MFLIKMVKEVFSMIEAIIIALILAILISVFVIQPYKVDGSSMEPTLTGFNAESKDQVNGDRVIAFKTPFIFGQAPEIGDVIIVDSKVNEKRSWANVLLENPVLAMLNETSGDEKYNWIKRVVGLPGDQIMVVGGKLYRNGNPVEEDYIKEPMLADFHPYTVPENMVFVMGDNRNGSTDSRAVGPIPMENIIGKVVLRYYPLDRIDRF